MPCATNSFVLSVLFLATEYDFIDKEACAAIHENCAIPFCQVFQHCSAHLHPVTLGAFIAIPQTVSCVAWRLTDNQARHARPLHGSQAQMLMLLELLLEQLLELLLEQLLLLLLYVLIT